MTGQYVTSSNAHQANGSTPPRSAAAYQIDCQTTKKGRMIAGTKRRICWRFGISNAVAVGRGLSGTDCRGEEHEVVFVWSLTSGKKFVLADGHEVHWSQESAFCNPFDGSWECSWQASMAGAIREMKVVAHGSSAFFDTKKSQKKSNTSVADGSFRRFDFLVDGVSFSEFPKVFELGCKSGGGNRQVGARNPAGAVYNGSSFEQQQSYGQTHSLPSFSSQPQLVPIGEQHQQYAPPKDRRIFQSQSMPDLLHLNLSHSPTSVLECGRTPPLSRDPYTPQNCQHQQRQSYPYQVPPLSVENPFDAYIMTEKSLKIFPSPTPQQVQVQCNDYYSFYPQQQHYQQRQQQEEPFAFWVWVTAHCQTQPRETTSFSHFYRIMLLVQIMKPLFQLLANVRFKIN